VTEPITFETEPDLPPVILSKAGEPAIGRIVWIDKSMQSQWLLKAQVRDENVEQELEAHWRIVTEDEPLPEFQSRPVEVADQPVRDLEIYVGTDGLLDYRCHRFELAVSGSFLPFIGRSSFDRVALDDEDDVAYAVWWIWEGEGEALTPDDRKVAISNSCPTEDVRAAGTTQGGLP
jgi:hypothetical protein